MGFYNPQFLQKRREEWKNALQTFQYRVEGNWYEATINEAVIEGTKLRYSILIPSTPNVAHRITGLRILDKDGNEAGFQELKIDRGGDQSLLTIFEFPIQEAKPNEEDD